MRLLSVLFLALLAVGCSTVVEREAPIPVRMAETTLDTTALVEALRVRAGTTVQALNGSWKEHAFQAQCVMKGNGETLTVVFLAPQMRLVTITVGKPHAVRCERAPRIPAAFEPEYALVDLAFVNLGTEELRRAVGRSLRVTDDGETRRVATPSGAPVAELVRSADGTRRYRNLLHGYEYELKTIQ